MSSYVVIYPWCNIFCKYCAHTQCSSREHLTQVNTVYGVVKPLWLLECLTLPWMLAILAFISKTVEKCSYEWPFPILTAEVYPSKNLAVYTWYIQYNNQSCV